MGKAWDVVAVGAYKGSGDTFMWTVLFADKCGSSTPTATPKPKPPATAKPKPKPPRTPKPTPKPTPRPTRKPTPTPTPTPSPRTAALVDAVRVRPAARPDRNADRRTTPPPDRGRGDGALPARTAPGHRPTGADLGLVDSIVDDVTARSSARAGSSPPGGASCGGRSHRRPGTIGQGPHRNPTARVTTGPHRPSEPDPT